MHHEVTVSESLDRCAEETLDFAIQVEKAIFEKASQSCAYGGVADTAEASEAYTHDPTFGEKARLPNNSVAITDSCRAGRTFPRAAARRWPLRSAAETHEALRTASRMVVAAAQGVMAKQYCLIRGAFFRAKTDGR